jgi:hypothetical protein
MNILDALNEEPEVTIGAAYSIRSEIAEKISRLSKSSVEVAWIFARIETGKEYQGWGYSTFNQWLNQDICNPEDDELCLISKSLAYQMRRIGTAFYKYKDEITALVNGGRCTIGKLDRLANLVRKKGLSIDAAFDYILNGTPLPDGYEEIKAEDESEDIRQLPVYVANGDYDNFRHSLVLHAIINKHKTINESLNGLVLSNFIEFVNLFHLDTFKTFHQYEKMIENDIFYCTVCGNIPLEPTLHHLIPRSISGGDSGPLALLCWNPCHNQVVQPEWEAFAQKILGPSYEQVKSALQAGRDFPAHIYSGDANKKGIICSEPDVLTTCTLEENVEPLY